MTDLGALFLELGLSQYLDIFIEQGFDTWETILDITESDFDALGVKLGHRRKLQRRIANSRGLSSDRALISPKRHTSSDGHLLEDVAGDSGRSDGKDGIAGSHTGKRKYRRHPKNDENAPERPPSAYVIFSNKMREDLKGRNLSFTEIAKLVGENWQSLSPTEKEPYEAQAFGAKEKYNGELGEYKKTESYKKHAEYLIEFKAKQSHQQAASESIADASKRPKLENQNSAGSNGTGTESSSTSIYGDNAAHRQRAESVTKTRLNSDTPPVQHQGLPNLTISKDRGSPSSSLSTVLPGYRDAIFGTMQQQQQQQTLAWRDTSRDSREDPSALYPQHLPRVSNMNDRRPGYMTTLGPPDSPGYFAPPLGGQGYTPPPLLSDSTTATAASSGSSMSANSLYTPRTPLEPIIIDRSLPMPPMFQHKPPPGGGFDTQLPPIRPPSLSPQSSLNTSYNSPGGVTSVDFSHVKPSRGFAPPPLQPGPLPPLAPPSSTEDTPLDPATTSSQMRRIATSTENDSAFSAFL